ncbi:hypothetical protein RB201_04440 [Streptomyces sp. S1A(2023)]
MTTQPQRLHHLLDRLLRGVLLPAEAEQLAGLVRAREERLADWKQAAGTGMTLADNLRTEILALAPGVPLICSDDRHKTQVLAQAIRIAQLEAETATLRDALGAVTGQCRAAEHRAHELETVVARARQAVDTGPVGSCCAHIIRAALTPPAGLCGCGRPDPGPCQPCPTGSPSLHCACTCEPAQAAP